MTSLGLKSGPSWPVGPSGLAWDTKERVEWANPGMISPLGRGHRGETLSVTSSRALYSSWGRGSNGNRGACSRHANAGACCGSKGSSGSRRAGGIGAGGKGVCSGRSGAWCGGTDRGSGALAHPRPERVSSSCLRHRRALGRAT